MTSYVLDEIIDIPVNGDIQNIHLRSNRPDGPVLLFVHGGPGECDRSWVMPKQSRYLADCCVMVCWDQRMAGRSYRRAQAHRDIDLDMLVQDMHDVVTYLCRRFHKEKIFIVGHSWGSILSCLYLPRYPQTVAAYVGMGQYVNGPENEASSYDMVYDYARRHGLTRALRQLDAIGRPVGGMYAGGLKAMLKERNLMNKFGGGTTDKQKENIFSATLVPFVTSGEYRLIPDLYRYAHGVFYNLRQLWEPIVKLEFDKTLRQVAVPVYIFQGDNDQNTPTAIARRWFDQLQAPYKEWVPFHKSAHSPILTEPELWGMTLRAKLFNRP